jgi:helicase MOV-10
MGELPSSPHLKHIDSIQQGDSILVQEQNTNSDKWFEGHVHSIRKTEIGLHFHTSFHEFNKGKWFHVCFKLNQLPIWRQHQALDSAFFQDRILFPEVAHLPRGPIRTSANTCLILFNPLITENEPQIQAVISILSLQPGPPPSIRP